MTANVLNFVDQTDGIGDNKIHINGTVVIDLNSMDAKKIKNSIIANDVTYYNADAAIDISGIALIQQGSGISGLTLAAPEEGVLCNIKITSLTGGSSVVTTAAGVTFDGINNTATFSSLDSELLLGYKTATQWAIITNVSVAMSSV